MSSAPTAWSLMIWPGSRQVFFTSPSSRPPTTAFDPSLRWLPLQATCSFFRQHGGLPPDERLPLTELAAFDMCRRRVALASMAAEEEEALKQRCGGSYKLLLKYLLAGERACDRREKFQVVAGPGFSIAVTSNGEVHTFGHNHSGQLGHGTLSNEETPRLISIKTPVLLESLKDIFVVQATIGHFLTAILSREGRVYTLSWGVDGRLGHNTDVMDRTPRLLSGVLEDKPVVQIAAGNCYLLALAFQPNGMCVYSLGCGLGGKLSHGSTDDEHHPRLIAHFAILNLQPIALSAGSWHAIALGKDGRICTWGWGHNGCLGHGDEDYQTLPKVVKGLSHVKVVHVAAGLCTTFVIAENGDIYSFGRGSDSNLGYPPQYGHRLDQLTPKLVTSLTCAGEKIIWLSATKEHEVAGHTFAMTESGKLYAFGIAIYGQLGIKLLQDQNGTSNPQRVDIDLS
ncbi:E3 ubiquitin-protein ligase [Musa troglodytarum]|uniref:E3 ubiquitin-protein ligase n=1 Tax=Musa troglodytarum TaxID=320322 RepID=A0A9E7F0S9_9LILI|nr:E3 ubiquitin-protein ligase [Musa troglodytarum]